MFQKLARAAVFAASLLLVISRLFFSVHLPARLVGSHLHQAGPDPVCIVSQLPARGA
jgi:hypothetical protein